jgi:hypothetical protein
MRISLQGTRGKKIDPGQSAGFFLQKPVKNKFYRICIGGFRWFSRFSEKPAEFFIPAGNYEVFRAQIEKKVP